MLNDLESKLQSLLERNITSVSELENWLLDEQSVTAEIEEEITSSLIATYRDTNDRNKRNLHMYNQNTIQPLLKRYNAKFDQKFIESPFSDLLDEQKYGFMTKARLIKSKMFNDKNIALTIKEQELITKYREIMSNISINWEGEQKTYAYVKAKLDNPNRAIREKAWYALCEARSVVKIEIDCIMNELVQLRNETALHAGFNNYSEYAFKQKNRDYSIEECYKLHESIEKYVVPIWKQLGSLSKKNLGVKTYRPWDLTPCNLLKVPFQNTVDLLYGVEEVFRKTDLYFYEKFIHIRKAGLEDEISSSWLESFHFIQFPFYKIEYAIAQIGAMQLFQIYREDPEKAIAFFKEGASADWNLSMQEIYEKTGITFDFSEERIESTASVIFDLINELK
ncbi:M3 family metallopeptidase [Bacillus wiedmannii]|uniref:M3 family metallopeptidase n=1 Tax=Bacillus wiedmannii TaxID=1890302 RepID=UPI0007DB1D46|nr:M3 family metallopeptidase [Bacillus wiedmannii]OAK04906.1 hypothetical protein A6280_07510 [Bacillus wiedmannii]OUB86070.1 hypothetical protein BK788_10255 [Bacillus thuringiensis serovar sinensis]